MGLVAPMCVWNQLMMPCIMIPLVEFLKERVLLGESSLSSVTTHVMSASWAGGCRIRGPRQLTREFLFVLLRVPCFFLSSKQSVVFVY